MQTIQQFMQTKRGEIIVITAVFVLAWAFWIVLGMVASYYHPQMFEYHLA